MRLLPSDNLFSILGLVVLENRLKPDTKAIVNQLSDAAVRTIMVTGKCHTPFWIPVTVPDYNTYPFHSRRQFAYSY